MSLVEKNILLLKNSIKKGNPKAFEAVFKVYYKDVVVYVRKYTLDRGLAEDITQEAFMKLWQKREVLNENISLIGFLYKTSYNIFVDGYRRKQTEKTIFDDVLYKKKMEQHVDDGDLKAKRLEIIKKGIEELPPKCKEVFIMNKQQGLRYQEIADKLNISVKTVEAQMGKAFTFLRSKAREE